MKPLLITFHNDPKIKEKYLARVQAHFDADEIIHGKYWEDGKGCAVGCILHSSRHANSEPELGIPQQLFRIADGIFESLSDGKDKKWPKEFLSAIPVGVNLLPAYYKFMYWLLTDDKEGVIRFAKTNTQKTAILDSANIYTRLINGEFPSYDECMKIRRAAAAAAARKSCRIRQSEKLIELFNNTK